MRSPLAIVIIGLIACSCSSTDDSPPAANSLVVEGAASPSTIAGSGSPADTLLIADATGADTTGADTTPGGSAEPATPRNETPLPGGTYRTDKVAGPIVPITFELPVDGFYTMAEEGFLSVMSDPSGSETLMTVTEVDNSLVFNTPTIAFDQLADPAYTETVTEPAPTDLLAWLAGRPGVEAGPIVDTTVAGLPARSMTYSIGAFDGATPCVPDDDRACHATLSAPITGLAQLYFTGDSGTLSELHLGGHRFAVDVADRPLAAEVAESLTFTVEPPDTAPAVAEPVPFTGPHRAGATYYSERSSGGLYLLAGFEGISTAESFLRTSQLRLEAEGVTCLVISDVANSVWRGVLYTEPVPLVSPPMPDDLIAAITGLEPLTIVTPAFPLDLNGTSATAIDVAADSDEVVILDRSLGVPPGMTLRFVEVPRPDGDGNDLISVVLGSPCEAVLATIELAPSGRD